MSKKHQSTLEALFALPSRANIVWKGVESLLISLGAKIEEGRGSRVRVLLNEEDAVFHRPYPQKEIDKGSVVSMRRFLENAGVKLC